MAKYDTGNPLGSSDPRDLYDNAENLDEAVNSSEDTFQDRLGKNRLTWSGIVKAGSGDPAIAVDAAARAEFAASSVEQDAEQIAQDAAQQAASEVIAGVDGQVAVAQGAADRAESAADVAMAAGWVYATVAEGEAARAAGEYFWVVSADESEVLELWLMGASSASNTGKLSPSLGTIRKSLYPVLHYAYSIDEGLNATAVGERFIVIGSESNNLQQAVIYTHASNLYNPSKDRDGYYLSTNGNIDPASGWMASDFIPVREGETYTLTRSDGEASRVGFFSSKNNGATVGTQVPEDGHTFTVPVGAKYIAFTVLNASWTEPLDWFMLAQGSKGADYAPFGESIAVPQVSLVSADVFGELAEYIISPNLFDPTAVRHEYYLNSSGKVAYEPGSTEWSLSDWIPVTAGEYITINPIGGERPPRISFFSEKNDSATPVYTGSEGSLLVTIQVPEGASWLLFTASNPSQKPEKIMVNVGQESLPWTPFGEGWFIKEEAIQQEHKDDQDDQSAVLSLAGTGSQLSSVTGRTDDGHIIENTFVAFPEYNLTSYPCRLQYRQAKIDGVTIINNSDDDAPDNVDERTIAGNHGYGLGICQVAGHGKTVADEGSVWESGGIEFVLVQIQDDNTLILARVDSNTSPQVGSYTHVSGGTNTASFSVSSRTSSQWYPPHTNYNIRVVVDDKEITEREGYFYYKNHAMIIESYGILDRNTIINWWINNGGWSGGPEPQGNPLYMLTTTHRFDKHGQLSIARDWLFLDQAEISVLMGLQVTRRSLQHIYYVPGAEPFEQQGYLVDYGMGEPSDLTVNEGLTEIHFDATNLPSSGEFGNRILSIFGDASFATGFLPIADASPDKRRVNVSYAALRIRGDTGKIYHRIFDQGFDQGGINVNAGFHISTIGYRHIVPKSEDRTSFYVVRPNDNDAYIYADWHNKSALDVLPIPDDLVGRSYEVVSSRGVIIDNGILAGSLPVLVNASANHAYISLKVT